MRYETLLSFPLPSAGGDDFLAFSNFIGGLLRAGLIEEREAYLLLVEEFWDRELDIAAPTQALMRVSSPRLATSREA